jgi:hypothetical protein
MEFDLGLEKHTSVEWLGCAIDRLGIGNSAALEIGGEHARSGKRGRQR